MRKSNVYEEPETLRLLGLDSEREERDEDSEWLARRDLERAADEIEELSAGYVDFRGFPLPGFESPRYLTEEQREYKRWYRGSSPEAAQVRRIREGA